MQLIVTRPEPQASAWAEALRAQGLDAQALPLIAIDGPADPTPVIRTWHTLADKRLLMFVSPAAVDWFFKLRPTAANWPHHTLAAAPGPGTARTLIALGAPAGLQAEQVLSPHDQAEQFDSEALWPVLAPLDWQAQTVAIISGGDQQEAKGRAWLSQQWQGRGARTESVLTYQRTPGHWTPAQQSLARQALGDPDQHLWLFSSSQAIDHLLEHHLPELGQVAPSVWSRMRVLSTHPKIAERARALGVTRITQTRPTLDAVAQAVVEARRSSE